MRVAELVSAAAVGVALRCVGLGGRLTLGTSGKENQSKEDNPLHDSNLQPNYGESRLSRMIVQ
jgi:hypothetical protein